MATLDISAASETYRRARKAVSEGSRDKPSLKQGVTDLCDRANLGLYAGTNASAAEKVWRILWITNRYGNIHARIATKEINDIQSVFNDFTVFCLPSWDVESHGQVRAGSDAQQFLDRTGPFAGRQTIGNLPKLKKIVLVARALNLFLQRKQSTDTILDFVTNRLPASDVWGVQEHLLGVGWGRINRPSLHDGAWLRSCEARHSPDAILPRARMAACGHSRIAK